MSLRFGGLAGNSNFLVFCVVKPWRVIRNIMCIESVYKFAACFAEYFFFFC